MDKIKDIGRGLEIDRRGMAKFLHGHGAQVTVTDHKSKPELSTQIETIGRYPY